MNLEFENEVFFDALRLNGSIELIPGSINLMYGENGAGKSSFFHFLKMNQRKFFAAKTCQFIDQERLAPLNEVSLERVLSQLVSHSAPEPIFEKYFGLADSFKFLPLNSLSGGQNQLAKILLGLFFGGDLYFFDEPFQYLDMENRQRVVSLIYDLSEINKYLLIIDHEGETVKWNKKFHLTRTSHSIRLNQDV